jgi:hypothetical protein
MKQLICSFPSIHPQTTSLFGRQAALSPTPSVRVLGIRMEVSDFGEPFGIERPDLSQSKGLKAGLLSRVAVTSKPSANSLFYWAYIHFCPVYREFLPAEHGQASEADAKQ